VAGVQFLAQPVAIDIDAVTFHVAPGSGHRA
jgi:hypothetical protein